jgi:NAD(P)-dependent dehydrogenase (short-subunit alcohol dehydrogenase family)
VDPFHGRVAVITGGAGGIGMAMARRFAARGAKLVLADKHEQRLDEAVAELRSGGAEAEGVITDVTRRDSVEALAETCFSRFGGAHIVCNNAGIAVLGPMVQATTADWQLTFDINFWGVVHGVQAFVPRMLEAEQGGHVVNTASMAGLTGMSWLGVYCASKFAVVGLTESLSRELRGTGIGVSLLCPMIVATNINANSRESLVRDAKGPTASVTPPEGDMKGGVVDPAEVGRRVERAIDRGEFYILTHDAQREILRKRSAAIDAVFEPSHWKLD